MSFRQIPLLLVCFFYFSMFIHPSTFSFSITYFLTYWNETAQCTYFHHNFNKILIFWFTFPYLLEAFWYHFFQGFYLNFLICWKCSGYISTKCLQIWWTCSGNISIKMLTYISWFAGSGLVALLDSWAKSHHSCSNKNREAICI